MDIFQVVTLAFIQGLTEFLPVSSSAHLVLFPKFFNWPDQGLAFDVILHFASLCAVVLYYRASIVLLSQDFFSSISNRKMQGDSILAWGVLLGAIPVGLAGFFFNDFVEINLRSFQVIAYTTIFFGIALGLSDLIHRARGKSREMIRGSDILIVGCFQALALIPGTSRAGITITAALLIGLSAKLSIKFAFLLSIPVITLATILKLFELSNESHKVDWLILLIGFAITFFVSYFTIVYFIKLVERVGLFPFVIYRILLGVLLFLI
ncbi:MAG: undecaprenyl-diphosphate phosphatase [Pseudomonadota bacterium]|nr:undecaprenyl-diphosphate phosphatase [Pseudomonadota bacterium]